ncbi:MAG: sensor histidine kinase [Saprospiraceae bacterium]
MRTFLFFLLFSLGSYANNMANDLPDNLLKSLKKEAEDTAKVWSYFKVAQYYQVSNIDSSIFYLDKALTLADRHHFNKGKAAALLRLMGIYVYAGQPERVAKYGKEALTVAQSPGVGEYAGKIYELYGNSMLDAMEPDSAFYYFSLAEKAYTAIGESYRNFSVNLGYSNIYIQEGDDQKAEAYLLKAYDISKTRRIRKDHGMVLYFLMDFYFSRNNMAAYAPYAAAYLELTGKDEFALEVDPMHQFLYFFDEAEPIERKIQKIKEVIAVQQASGYYRNLAISYDYLCELQEEIQDWKGALQTALAGLELTKSIKHLNEETAFTQMIANIYEHLGNYEMAHHYLKSAIKLQDSIHLFVLQKNKQELEVQFETEKKEAALAISELELERKTSQQRSTTVILGVVAALALVTLWFLYFKSKTNKILSEKNTIIGRALAEKEVLLKEIHHRVKNNLQVISSLLNLQSKSLQDAKAKAAILDGQNRVKSMALIHQNLYLSDNLATVDINNYIGRLTENLFHSYNIKDDLVRLKTDIDSMQMDVDTLIPLGLILNEVLSNALKHAFPANRSGTIEVLLKEKKEGLLLRVKDDGIGFAPQAISPTKHSLGMILIQDFSRKLKAEMTWEGNNGTEFKLLIHEYKIANWAHAAN